MAKHTLKVELSEEENKKLADYCRVNNVTPKQLAKNQLLSFIKINDANFDREGSCPRCKLEKRGDTELLTMPIREAGNENFFEASQAAIRYLEETDTIFAVCPNCLWWGIPSQDNI